MGILAREAGQQVCLYDVVDIAEIAAGFAVAVDIDLFAPDQGLEPLGNDGGIRAVRVLALAKDVEIAQADGWKAVAALKDVCIKLVNIFGYRIGREGMADAILDLGQFLAVAVGGGGGRIDKALRARVARGKNHVEKTVDIAAVGENRVVYRPWHGAKSGLVQHMVNAGAGVFAGFKITDIAFDKDEAGKVVLAHKLANHFEIAAVAGKEIVQANDFLAAFQQPLQQV